MYLKRLEIQGFKSFANRTVLDFLPARNASHSDAGGPPVRRYSMTGIVGPNGSGKSNVTDAIRWVMGEQSMKTVRAKKSEDVIFSGSETKGALGAAEVTMTLDNTGSETGLEYPEIVITRRLYRSGESEYLVNNSSARLIDIHLLLAKAQFAEHAYSIVSQGMIDRLLTVTPSERKDFFDEASGIKEHQIKQHQASLKLARTEENITQAETLLHEVAPRLKLLAKQVKKLEQRHEVETELRATQEQYYFILYFKNKTEIDALRHKMTELEASYRAAFTELETTQNELAQFARSATRQEVFQELQNRYQNIIKEKNELERSLAIIEGQMHTEYSQAGAHNVGWLTGKASELKAKVAEQQVAAKTAEHEADKAGGVVAEERTRVENLQVEHTQLKLKIARLQSELVKDQSEHNYYQLSGLTAVKAVLEARGNFGNVFGVVAELGEVAEEYRVALEVAAGSHLSSVVVENEIVARKAIEYLRAQRYGVATFLPLNKIMARTPYGDTTSLLGEPGVIGKAIDLVKFDPKFANIFSLIFGNTLIVEDLRAAERIGIGRARMVTLEGDVVEQKGIMRGGFRQRKNSLSFSSKLSLSGNDRAAEIQAAINLESNNLTSLERNLENTKTALMEITVAAASARNKATLVAEEFAVSSRELAKVEQELATLTASPEAYGEQLKKLALDKEVVTNKMAALTIESQKAEMEIAEFNRKEEEKKQRVFKLQEKMQHEQTRVNTIVAERGDLNVQLAKLETKQEDLGNEVMSDMHISLQSIAERFTTPLSLDELPRLADSIQKLKYQLSLIGGIDDDVIEEHRQTKERHDFLVSQLDDLNKAVSDLSTMIEELDELMKKKRATAFKQIRKEFDRYFKILFGGGSAELEEIYGEPPTEESEAAAEMNGGEVPVETDGAEPTKKKDKILTGIDVIANPPGKKIKLINALSGGERTLTSIALICAILHTNPSPFVVLDEVEAALDEANTLRFTKIMAELSTRSQFIIVTHNRVTMHAVDALYGVVMKSDGISQLLSVKIEDVPQFDESGNLKTA